MSINFFGLSSSDYQYLKNWIEEREWTKVEGRRNENGTYLYYPYKASGENIYQIGPGIRCDENHYPMNWDSLMHQLYDQIVLGFLNQLHSVVTDFNSLPAKVKTSLASFIYNTGKVDSDLYTYINNKEWQKMYDFWISHYTTAIVTGKQIGRAHV